MKFETITYQNYELEYAKFGTGERTFIAFHGHGRQAEDFETFAEDLNATIYSFNLFFHGKSLYQENKIKKLQPITHEELKSVMAEIKSLVPKGEINFIAYSLGGKFTLNFISYFPTSINQVILMAPDGLAHSFYSRSQHVPFFRWWFRRIVAQPKNFLKLCKFLTSIRLIPKNVYKFLDYQLETPSRRLRAFLSWTYFRKIYPDHKKVKANLHQHNIDLILLMAEYDRVIPLKFAKKFIKKMGMGRLFTIPTNHHLFRPSTVPEIKKMLRILAQQDRHDEQKD